MSVLLASGSPQRSAILGQLRVPFRVWVPRLQERVKDDPISTVLHNSRLKAEAGRPQASPDEIVMGVDTIVAVGGQIFGKPSCEDDAREMLVTLRGRSHTVHSGLTLCVDGQPHGISACTGVAFREFDNDELDFYLATGEWDGRAGGYAIQGAGAALVSSVEGDFYNVVGLPVAALMELISELRIRNRMFMPLLARA